MRRFLLIPTRPIRVAHSSGGARRHVVIRATEPGEAYRLYWQQFPDGPEIDRITELDPIKE